MRVGFVVPLGALIVVGMTTVVQLASAQTPVPTNGPTESPSPTPIASPTPFSGSPSTITIRFLSNGQPVTVSILAFSPVVTADGVRCLVPATEFVGSQYSIVWPLPAGGSQPADCTKGPPTTLRIEFGTLFTEFVWMGRDVAVDIEVPAASATPAPTSLPQTGADPGEGISPDVSRVALLVAFALLAFLLSLRSILRD